MPSQSGHTEVDLTIERLPELLIGNDREVPIIGGRKRYVNFDNASSTPTFKNIADTVDRFLGWYSNVHRGTGFKSQISSWVFEESRKIVARFVGADPAEKVVLYTRNSTEAINKLARRFAAWTNAVVLTSLMEHSSNELPWRRVATVDHIGLNDDGTVSKEDFERKLKIHKGRLRLVAITGASNVNGYINDIDYFARRTHEAGAQLLVDGAQLVPHRPVNMKASGDPSHIDYLVFSAHKMYAPYGIGVLVGDRQMFETGDPDNVGGGVVDMVTLEDAYWSDLPDKEEAGTPDIVGVVALGAVIKMFERLGWENIVRHEAELTAHTLRELSKIPGVAIYGDGDPENAVNRLGVISFNVGRIPHALTAAILNYEGAIGVRAGCFCSHTYVKSLLNIDKVAEQKLIDSIISRDRSHLPGAVRASFGIYNTHEEVDELIFIAEKIAAGRYYQDYVLNKEKGEYRPREYAVDFREYFDF